MTQIFNRSSMLTCLILTAILFVGFKIYAVWQESPLKLPEVAERKSAEPARDNLPVAGFRARGSVTLKNIIDRNLFDPERSSTKISETQSIAMRRLRTMTLIGTAILGDSRYAILQLPADAGAQKNSPTYLRLEQGDGVDGFHLTEIHERHVVFANAQTRLEIELNFSRRREDIGLKTLEAKGPSLPRRRAATMRDAAAVPAGAQKGATRFLPRLMEKLSTKRGQEPGDEKQPIEGPGRKLERAMPPQDATGSATGKRD